MRSRKPRLITALLFIACVACTVIACSPGSEQEPQASDASMVEGELREAFAQLIESADGYEKPTAAVQWPKDSFPHMSAQAESWQIMGVLQNVQGARYSLMAQLDRIGIRDADVLAFERTSDWQFRDVMRASLNLFSDSEPRRDWQAQQRLALGLAGTEVEFANKLSDRTSARVFLGPSELQISTSEGVGQSPCPLQYDLSIDEIVQISMHQSQCSESNAAGPLRVMTSASLELTGQLGNDDAVQGVAWVRHVWGELPVPGGPVVFDSALIELEQRGLLVVSRSKRRSGKGPETIEAHWHNDPQSAVPDLIWEELRTFSADAGPMGTDRVSTASEKLIGQEEDRPAQRTVWQLSSASADLDIRLEPVSLDATIQDIDGARWSGAVLASGSHAGVGFVQIQSVPARQAQP